MVENYCDWERDLTQVVFKHNQHPYQNCLVILLGINKIYTKREYRNSKLIVLGKADSGLVWSNQFEENEAFILHCLASLFKQNQWVETATDNITLDVFSAEKWVIICQPDWMGAGWSERTWLDDTHTSRLPCYVFVRWHKINKNPNANKLSWAINYTHTHPPPLENLTKNHPIW